MSAKVYKKFLIEGIVPEIKKLFTKLFNDKFNESDIISFEKEIDTIRFTKVDIVKEDGYSLMYIALIDNTTCIQNAWDTIKHEIVKIERYLYTLPFMSIKIKTRFENSNSVRTIILIGQNGLRRDERIAIFNIDEIGIVTAYVLKYRTVENEESGIIELIKESIEENIDVGNIDEIDFERFLADFSS